MRCGLLCDKTGTVKRTWSLVNDQITIPVADGDRVIEWDVEHGETAVNASAALSAIQDANKEQARVVALTSRTRDAALAHCRTHRRTITEHIVHAPFIDAAIAGPLCYHPGKGLHYRTIDPDGNLQDQDAGNGSSLRPILHASWPTPIPADAGTIDDVRSRQQ